MPETNTPRGLLSASRAADFYVYIAE